MKNIIKTYSLLLALLFVVIACNDDDSFTYSIPPQVDVVDVELSAMTDALIPCNADLTVTVTGASEVYYMLRPANLEAPLSSEVFGSGTNLSFDSAGTQSFEVAGFVADTDYVIYAISVNTDGLRSEQVYTSNYSHPDFDGSIFPDTHFLGDYTIADNVATIGPGNGTANFAEGTVTLTVDPFDSSKRLFGAAVLPAFNGEIESIILEFASTNQVILGDVDPSLSCGGGIPYIFTEADINNSIWNVCDDSSIIINYTEDPNGSCGGPYASSLILTKI